MRFRGRAGTAAVEFALVLPLLLVLVLGTVEMGFLILSHASMNTTMSRIPDLARSATDASDLQARLDALAELRMGLGLAQVSFDPVTDFCACPSDAVRGLSQRAACPARCDSDAEALHLYTVTGRVRVPSLIPGGDSVGERDLAAQLTVLGR